MTSILPFDELNRVDTELRERFGKAQLPQSKEVEEDIIDMLYDLFLLAYATGAEVTNANLSYNWIPSLDDITQVVDAKVAGKTWKERVKDYFADGGTGEDIARIADTEMHRIANTAALDTAKKAGATKKTWITMLDDKVRDTHSPLEGVSAPIDGEFVTWDGDRAQAPGLFSMASNNVNCRCELLFS